MSVPVDRYENQLRAGYHVADLRGDSKNRGKVVAVLSLLSIEVEWDNGATENVHPNNLVVTDTIHIIRRRSGLS